MSIIKKGYFAVSNYMFRGATNKEGLQSVAVLDPEALTEHGAEAHVIDFEMSHGETDTQKTVTCQEPRDQLKGYIVERQRSPMISYGTGQLSIISDDFMRVEDMEISNLTYENPMWNVPIRKNTTIIERMGSPLTNYGAGQLSSVDDENAGSYIDLSDPDEDDLELTQEQLYELKI